MATRQAFRSSNRRDQIINEQRRRLEQLRLQTESENTKLLKITQKQREVEGQYQNEKKNMEKTLAKLALEAEHFMNKQVATTQEFESQKQQIFANDRKKEIYLKQKQELSVRNEKRREEISEKEKKLAVKKEQLEEIRKQIKKHQIYQDFLREVKAMSEDFNTGEFDEFSVMNILQRYRTMEKKKQELSDLHKRIGEQKQSKSHSLQRIKKLKEEKILQYNAQIKQLKENIDECNELNMRLESELEGKLNENGDRQRELGQIIFSIRGLYLSIVGEQKNSKTTLEMLQVIKEERKKLKQYLDIFQRKALEEKSR